MEKVDNTLKNARVFYRHRLKFGIPAEVFMILLFLNVFALILAIKFFSIVSILSLGAFFLVCFVPMKFLFREDPQAHRAWASGYFSNSKVGVNGYKKRNVSFF
ncbi:TPA: VirB3 family type IV secretion system protein [Proteus mirabilis]|uniref:VirB3 family type IV secretion system protein n=1 Tax=Proteus mirabilis TaxID=584 RepID=UPI001B36EE9B|nr:VirB3 family type IV secretion system protein [Proteus mirabilis]MBQ0619614.1 VirB3 family type IV secretion system protein [Proteus mirabilis]MCJ2220437.1 VirB3 family type IV secretion system protein [Proteus mirabilis]